MIPALTLAILGAACGMTEDRNAPQDRSAIPAVSKDDRLSAMVPSDVKQDGRILVGQDQTNPPTEFVENGEARGMDVDLGRAVGQKLGVPVEFENAAFDGIIPGVQSGRYEAAMSSFTINAQRLREVDMVSYLSAGISGAVPKGNPDRLTLDTLCGRNVAVQKGTLVVEDLVVRSGKCRAAGLPEINVQQFQNQTDANLALSAKRAHAMLADSPIVDYAIKQTDGTLEHLDKVYNTAPYGLVLPKGKGDYAKAVQGAIQALMDDGTYKRILDKWGVQGAIPMAEVNPG
ncbi:ABC transporter substrate-binding protein [Kibdelosporangium phytohabitans]|uniref:ABC transporter substrate-binding protein n=1 Tax=Kibdelosporangium phytohabitans TaxID=860235 RepID=A0A0N9HYM0_9PSEU|nr:ABC transporter substrate-binding protein [Kibdelosporangium phytohabitans]